MSWRRMRKLFLCPFKMLYAKFFPEKYARAVGVKMGKNVHIYGSSYSMFSTEPFLVTLGDDVYIVGDTLFIPHDGGTLILRKQVPDLEITKPIVVGSNVYIGARCILMPGVHIGNNVILGAGAIVTHDIPDNSVAAGVPARVIKTLDQYFEKIQSESLHLGHLVGDAKERRLKELFRP